jgi:hypothetical protein
MVSVTQTSGGQPIKERLDDPAPDIIARAILEQLEQWRALGRHARRSREDGQGSTMF